MSASNASAPVLTSSRPSRESGPLRMDEPTPLILFPSSPFLTKYNADLTDRQSSPTVSYRCGWMHAAQASGGFPGRDARMRPLYPRKGKPVVRRGRKAMGLAESPREGARLPGCRKDWRTSRVGAPAPLVRTASRRRFLFSEGKRTHAPHTIQALASTQERLARPHFSAGPPPGATGSSLTGFTSVKDPQNHHDSRFLKRARYPCP
jgi:hypothetical protein